MTAPKGDARSRLPREPYPGLRPFLDFEAALLFGRERQVREVIEHLRESQFVAVLGGSGSGKSSLIHAGVVPELRSFGIPGAGDLWLPMTCTPGTNVSADDRAARRVSPVTRLARRFAGLLKSRGSDEADAQRLQQIADVFRQEAGFARLIDTYGGELAVPPGPDPAEARVLFVLDQFEELFHPTNKGVTDATLLVERVLDHFFNPHPRCHVVLTMRSEHLNDCAAFLELPDAINKSSYLVRRLDDDELRGAIVGPAQRFLRLAVRSQAEGAAAMALPTEVRFEPAVLDRLLRDVKALTHDPDHLPLLQHLLARLWEAALEREEMDIPVPSHITEIDLVRAVGGGRSAAAGDEQPLDDRTNTLRACVENWPETIYQWQGEKQRAQLDALFSRLAYKDPNTGMYSQQRVDVDAVTALLGPGKTRTDLRALLAEGFLGSVDYLHWDDEDPARVTLKVSHESFIRGWARFRQLIDREGERFDEFMDVLRRCAAWVASGRPDDLLLEAGELRLLRESAFEERLRAPGQQDDWFRFLLLDRDGARLSRHAAALSSYLDLSNDRLRARERVDRRRRASWWLLGSLLLVPPAFSSFFVQDPATQRAELLLDAGARANRAPLTTDHPGIGGAGAPLASLLRAAELLDAAYAGAGWRMRLSGWIIEHLSWVPSWGLQRRFFDGLSAQTEPQVNGRLRQLLTGAVWAAGPRPADLPPRDATRGVDLLCQPEPGSASTAESLNGRFYAAPGAAAVGRLRPGLFVPAGEGASGTAVELHGALVDAAQQACTFGPTLVAVPRFLEPRIAFDSGLRHLAYAVDGPGVELPSVTLLALNWTRTAEGGGNLVRVQAQAVVTGAEAVAQLRQATGGERVAVVDSWPLAGGTALALGTTTWRLVSPSARPLPVAPDDARFVPLQPAAPGSACAKLSTAVAPPPGFRQQVFEQGGHCFQITRGRPVEDAAAADVRGGREQVLVAVVGKRAAAAPREHGSEPAPVASLAPYAALGPGDAQWMVGVRGEYAGWLAARDTDAGGAPRVVGLPWSTCALWRLGRAVQDANPAGANPAGARAAAPAGACSSR